MKIECKELRSYHKYIHKLPENVICCVLSIDNTGNVIEVFYIRTARQCIQAYVQVSDFDVTMVNHKQATTRTVTTAGGRGTARVDLHGKEFFQRFLQIGKENTNNPMNIAFKQELNERLQLKLDESSTIGFEEIDDNINRDENELEPGQSLRNSNINLLIQK